MGLADGGFSVYHWKSFSVVKKSDPANLPYEQWLAKSESSLAVARWCAANGHFDSACNRAFFAVLQAEIAALLFSHVVTESQIASWIDKPMIWHGFHTLVATSQAFDSDLDRVHADARSLRSRGDYKMRSAPQAAVDKIVNRTEALVDAVRTFVTGGLVKKLKEEQP